MKALSLTQPWAHLVVAGAKKYETRSWSTKYRGPLYIHAAKGFPGWAKEFAMEETTLGRLPDRIARGAIIGSVVLEAVLRTDEVWWQIDALERRYGDFAVGRFAWQLSNPIYFDEPYPYKGALGLFEVKFT